MTNKEYDLVVIGTGSAGSSAAYRCKKAGWNVAIIDSRPFGGTCALRGCDPKKILVGAAEIVDRSTDLKGNGILNEPEISWFNLMKFKRTFTDPIPENREEGFNKAGIDTYHGQALFIGKNTIQLKGKVLKAKHIVIATGAKPRKLDITGEKYVSTSDDFLEVDNLPQEIIFIGGGYISFELAHVAMRAGAKTRILHRSEEPLSKFDPDLVNMLTKSYNEAGISVELNMPVNSIEKKGEKLIVRAGENNEHTYETDMVVHGGGRIPNLDGLDLEKAGIEVDKKGIIINDYLQSVSNPIVYVAGDANARGIPLTPVAGMEGKIIAQNLLESNKTIPEYNAIPTVVFSIPPLASVGIGEEEAKKRGINYKVNFQETSSWYSSRRIGLKYSGFKVLIDNETNQIIGAHLLYPNADEIINLFTMAMKVKLNAEEFKDIIFAYPTAVSDIKYML